MLYAQLQDKEIITQKRGYVFDRYYKGLEDLEKEGLLKRIKIPAYNTTNYHIFYIILNDAKTRDNMLNYLKGNKIGAVFHYIPLHLSPMGRKMGYKTGDFPVSETLSECLIRLPLFADLSDENIDYILSKIHDFFKIN